jgi:hypothetical protein
MSLTVPPQPPPPPIKKTEPKRRVVFVDPDDPQALYWWPAMVVPPQDFRSFRKMLAQDITEPQENEFLVCYFEDGSFSTVGASECVPFCPTDPPYSRYLRGPHRKAFISDQAIKYATLYWDQHIVPLSFTWVQDEERALDNIELGRRVKREHALLSPSASVDKRYKRDKRSEEENKKLPRRKAELKKSTSRALRGVKSKHGQVMNGGTCTQCGEEAPMRVVKTMCPGCSDLLDRAVYGVTWDDASDGEVSDSEGSVVHEVMEYVNKNSKQWTSGVTLESNLLNGMLPKTMREKWLAVK